MSESRINIPGIAEESKTDFAAAFASIAAISAIGVAIGLSFPLLSLILEQRGYSGVIIGANAASAGVAAMAAVWLVNPMVNRLGVINHTLLTVRNIQQRGLHCAGVILNYVQEERDAASISNHAVLDHCLGVPVLAEVMHGETEIDWPL